MYEPLVRPVVQLQDVDEDEACCRDVRKDPDRSLLKHVLAIVALEREFDDGTSGAPSDAKGDLEKDCKLLGRSDVVDNVSYYNVAK